MRPLPENCKLFAALTGMHHTRPWWGAGRDPSRSEGGEGWTRRDGWQLYDNGYRYYSSAPLSGDLMETPEAGSYEELMAIIDAKWPLPAPPLRAGQVWLLEARQAWTTALLNTTLHGFMRTSHTAPHPMLSVPGLFPEDTMYGYEAFAPARQRARAMDDASRRGMIDMIGMHNGYLLGDQYLPGTDAERLLLGGDDPLIKTYLIADPVDPSIVPWTGCKVLGWP
ncbi:hypothetical protein N9917_03215 [Deltaproteobacteria bacterium]|nr:hypothetical protein [Deltaproteobacteria bacterium]